MMILFLYMILNLTNENDWQVWKKIQHFYQKYKLILFVVRKKCKHFKNFHSHFSYPELSINVYHISSYNTYHIFHAYADFTLTVECTVEPYDKWRVTFVEDLQLSNDLFTYSWFDLQVNQLQE